MAGSLDIAGRNQALGAPKIVSGIMTSLYLVGVSLPRFVRVGLPSSTGLWSDAWLRRVPSIR